MKEQLVPGVDVPLARLIEELSQPDAYDHPVDPTSPIGVLQTHISVLFFVEGYVYKVKKSVDLGFLDFTSLERRRHFCHEEVRLNSRMSPDMYLGVVPITCTDAGRLVVGGEAAEGAAVEWAVKMVRLPEGRMFSSLLERGEIDNEKMNSIASLLADFHDAAATGAGVNEHGSVEAITRNVEQNFEQLAPFVEGRTSGTQPRVLSERQFAFLEERARARLSEQRELFERRVRDGRIRDGHGDLHAGNICFARDGLAVYDCIEFSDAFRCGDVISDMAFLAMDIDSRGFPSFARYLMKRYAKVAGDPEVDELERFYKSYRAVVRAKVAAMTAASPDVNGQRRQDLRREAMRYVHLASAYELPPALILMCGLPACGKSWIAARLARSLRAGVVQSDVRRKTLAGKAVSTRVHEDYEAGLYSPEMKAKTYRSLLEGAIETVRAGHTVIVDATFSKREYRMPFVDAAARLDLPYYVVHVTAPDAVIRERLAQRAKDKHAISDADLGIYLRAKETFEPPTESPADHVLDVVSGDGIPEEQSSIVIDRMIALREG